QQRAGAGDVLLGATAHALVAHAVTTSAVAQAFRLEAVDPEATALARRDDTALIGRERELDRLRADFAAISESGARQLTIVGEPGIGKSRLTREFLTEIAGEATVLIGR